MEKQNVIVEKSFQFALRIIEFCELLEEQKKYIISRQLLKSGTSIGANVREGQGSESRADFIHKMKIAIKEAEETEYWLLVCKFAKSYPSDETLLTENKEILRILNRIISTAKKNEHK